MNHYEEAKAAREAMLSANREAEEQRKALRQLQRQRLPRADSALLSEAQRWSGSSMALKFPLADGFMAIYMPVQELSANEIELVENMMRFTLEAYTAPTAELPIPEPVEVAGSVEE